jgi:hypothetical protein
VNRRPPPELGDQVTTVQGDVGFVVDMYRPMGGGDIAWVVLDVGDDVKIDVPIGDLL